MDLAIYIVFLLLALFYAFVAFIGWMFDKGVTFSDFFWEYGECRDWVARRNRFSGSVYMLMYDQNHKKHWYPFAVRYWQDFRYSNESKKNNFSR